MKKLMIRLSVLIMLVTAFWFVGTNQSQVLAAENEAFFAEAREGIVIANDMIVPEPEMAGKDKYIFAGYYEEPECESPVTATTDETVYAKFVPSNILSVKAQLKSGTTDMSEHTNLRLVTSVDSLNYKSVGYEIYYNNASKPIVVKTTKVYERIMASTETGIDYNYSPKVVDVESEYFVTAALVNIQNKNFDKGFYIKPYWQTLDGTVVYGEGKYLTINNGLDANNINVTVKVNTALNVDALSATVGGKSYPLTVAYYDGAYAYLNITVNNKINVLKSLSEIVVTDGTTTGRTEYRNLMTKYAGDGTEDTSWYDFATVDTNKYIIATSADLYGLATLVNADNSFEGNQIYVVADITVNTGNANSWGVAAPKDAQIWKSIGYYDTTFHYFKGTFDAQMHTISGLYNKNLGRMGGFFGPTQSATIQNLKLVNCYFKAGESNCGSVVGYANGGNFKNIYSDANVVGITSYPRVGGLIGNIENATLEACWFDGNIIYEKTDNKLDLRVGGLVGSASNGTENSIKHCLNTGTVNTIAVTGKSEYIGGLVGHVYSKGALKIENSINAGRVTHSLSSVFVDALVSSTTSSIINSYATIESWSGFTSSDGRTDKVATADILGDNAKTRLHEDFFKEGVWTTVDGHIPVLTSLKTNIRDDEGYDENTDETLLSSVYGIATISQGDMHAHCEKDNSDGVTDNFASLVNPKVQEDALRLWQQQLNDPLLNLKFSFISSLDHYQFSHGENPGWDSNRFLYGTEPEAEILNKVQSSNGCGMLHYNILFAGANAVQNLKDSIPQELHGEGEKTTKPGLEYHYNYQDNSYSSRATEEWFTDLINRVQTKGGFFVIPHPSQVRKSNKPFSTLYSDFVFKDKTGKAAEKIGFEVIASYCDSNETKTNYEYWKQLLADGHKYFACAGSDVHGSLEHSSNIASNGDLKIKRAVTSVYTVGKNPVAYLEQFKNGNFTAGGVGIKMCVGDLTTGETVAMGSECDFSGKRLVVQIGDFYNYLDVSKEFRVEIHTENGMVHSQEITASENAIIAFDADEKAKFYRVEVRYAQDNTCVAYGNPIWNTNEVK